MSLEIDHSIDPQKKDKQWISDYIHAAWNDFCENSGSVFYNNRKSFHEIRQCMLGRQDISKYKKILIPDDDANSDTTWMNIDWAILPIVPKFRRMIVDIVRKLRYQPSVHAIDSLAKEDQDKYYAEVAAKIQMRDYFKQQGLDPAMIGLDTETQDMEELEAELMYSWKDNQAKDVEIFLDQIFENSRYDEIRDDMITDLTDIGVACAEEYVDFDGEILCRYVDAADMVVPHCEKKDFSDAEYLGEVRFMTISEIANMSSSEEVSSQEFKDLKERIEERKPNDNNDTNTVGNKFRVLHLKFVSPNHQTFEYRTNEDGKVFFGKKTKGSKNKEFQDAYYDVVYEGYWCVDTDYYFGCELATDVRRDPENLKITTLPYHIYAPDLKDMQTYSLGAQMMSIADQIQLAYFKMQNAIIKSRPAGVMYEFSSIQDVTLGGQDITAQDILKLYNYTGNFGYRRIDEDGEVTNWAPIQELKGGLGDEGQTWLNQIAGYIQMLREITGLNEITDGSSPDPKMVKSAVQLAALSTNNSLRYIHEAEKKLTDRVGTALMQRIQDAAANGNLEMYIKSVGSSTIKHALLTSDVSYRKLGLVFEEEPSIEDQEWLNHKIELALSPQGEHPAQITIDDAVFIRRIKNLRQAEQYLSLRVKKNKEINDAKQMQVIQSNAEAQQQSAQVAEQARQQTETLKFNFDQALQEQKYKWEMQIEQMKAGAILQGEGIKANARDLESTKNNNTKDLISERQEETKKAVAAETAKKDVKKTN